jgi:two-component system sensor histidine kinase KdpD
MRSTRQLLERYGYVFAVLCIAASTAIFVPGRNHFAKGQWALLYLLIIGLVAGVSGVGPALLASVLAFFAWNFFFLPPHGTLSVHDPTDWLSLIVFLLVGIAMGLQTGRMRAREAQALARERETALLNRFSAHLVSDAPVHGMARYMLDEVTTVGGARCAALFMWDGSGERTIYRPSSPDCPETTEDVWTIAEWVRREAKAVGLPRATGAVMADAKGWPVSVSHAEAGALGKRQDIFLPLQSPSRMEGVLYVGARADGSPYTAHGAGLLVSIANQAAAFLERKHLQAAAVQADALREADRLKSTFISSISHELRTPLASVTATITGLLEGDVSWDAATARSELEAIREDLDRLNSSIGSLLDLSRLESAAWEPKPDSFELGEILGTVLARIPEDARDRLSFQLPEDLPTIRVDFDQWARLLQILIENALAYGESRPVKLAAVSAPKEIRMWVEDDGPGIPDEEKNRVFDKFYRGASAPKSPSGTGLGLAIALEIVRSHHGRIWVEDAEPHGARFVISLPKDMQPGAQHHEHA